MEHRNPHHRFVLISALLAGLVACGDGGAAHAGAAQSAVEVAQCSTSLPANSSAVDIQRAIDDVLSGAVDPCDGKVDLTSTRPELLRVDFENTDVRIFFRMLRYKGFAPTYNIP